MHLIIISIVVGLVLAFLIAPFMMLYNKRIMNEIHAVLANFETFQCKHRDKDKDYIEAERKLVVKKVIALKAKLFKSDRSSVALATDLLNNI